MLDVKTIFIIPGFRHLPSNTAYKKVAKLLKNEGYLPIPITIPWRQSTISEHTEYFLKEYKKVKAKKKYILGFSFGAMIAFIAATKVEVTGLILCSLSPYFKEDLSVINESKISSIMIKRYKDFSLLRCGSLAKRIKAKQVLMLYGAKEAKSLIKRVNAAFDQMSPAHKYIFPIHETAHDIGDRRYLHQIQQVAKAL